MKNIINITTEGEQLVSSTDDGTNTLYINDNEIPSSNWIGSGNYTTTVNGHAITIKKCTDLNGNCQLVKLSDYNYEMRKTALAGQLQMLNYIYPVGSYYETSDSIFDPNTAWGGTWTSEQIKDDKIVDEGETGIWTYRKWKSGIAECWGTYSGNITSRTANAPYNSSVFDVGVVYYPSNFFADIPVVSVNTRIGSFYNLTSYANSYQNNVSISITSNATGTQTVYAYISAKGKWKSYVQPQTLYRWHRTA